MDKVGNYDWFNRHLFEAIPAHAERILDVGCNTGLLGEALKNQRSSRYVAGVELDPAAVKVAGGRLDAVHLANVEQDDLTPLGGDFDAIVLGDVIEHLIEPALALEKLRDLLADDGELYTSIPNIQHYSIFRRLLKGDFQYRDTGLLDATHMRFFCLANIAKLMLDAGYLPRLCRRIIKPDPELQPHLEQLASRMGVNRINLQNMQTFQYQTAARKAPPLTALPAVPVTFIVHSRYTGILKDNLLASPLLKGNHPHQVIVSRAQHTPLAEAWRQGLSSAKHEVVALVQEHMYLPKDWAHRLAADIVWMERRAGADWVAGGLGYSPQSGREPDSVRTNPAIGAVIRADDKVYCSTGDPVEVTSFGDELILMPTENALILDADLGDNLYGIELGLRAGRMGRAGFALHNPCLNNSQFLNRKPPGYDASRDALLAKWPESAKLLNQAV